VRITCSERPARSQSGLTKKPTILILTPVLMPVVKADDISMRSDA
jgi:hypothetical protein